MSVHILRRGACIYRRPLISLRSASCRLYSAPAVAQRPQPDTVVSHNEPSNADDGLEPPGEPTASNSSTTVKERASASKKRIRKPKSSAAEAQPEASGSQSSNAAPLAPSRTDMYLASIQAAGLEPRLSDLERCRPARHPHPDSPMYSQKFNDLIDTLCRAFSKAQLRKFIKMYGMDQKWSGYKRKKIDYAETIIERQWEWPSLKGVQKAQRDRTEVTMQSLPMTPSQLFLILGKDGADLLKLSMEYKVHISLIPNPLGLRVEGLRGALSDLSSRLLAIKNETVEETFQLPTRATIQPDLIQRISRLAGAYLENIGDKGLARICAKDPHSLASAKRLAIRSITELHVTPYTPILSYLPLGVPSETQVPSALSSHTYSLYPFLSPRPLPWVVNNAGGFRVRRVGEWLSQSLGENIRKTGGLSSEKGRILTIEHEITNLRKMLLANPVESGQDGENYQRTIKASFGHLIFTESSAGQHSGLIPPLRGSHQYGKILQWILNNNARSSFVSSLPAYLVHSLPSKERVVHRLIYRVLPKTLPDSNTSLHKKLSLSTTKTINLEVVIEEPKPIPADTSAVPLLEDPSAEPTYSAPSLSPQYWRSTQAELDLMMPDRPIDLRFSVLDTIGVAESQAPQELRNYTSSLSTYLSNTKEDIPQPDPPLMLYHNGYTYMLHTNATVRQNVEHVGRADDGIPHVPVHVLSESVLDLESNQRATQCEVTCDDPTSDTVWARFLGACDTLSSVSYRPANTVSFSRDIEV